MSTAESAKGRREMLLLLVKLGMGIPIVRPISTKRIRIIEKAVLQHTTPPSLHNT
jgi:hypothetical protein